MNIVEWFKVNLKEKDRVFNLYNNNFKNGNFELCGYYLYRALQIDIEINENKRFLCLVGFEKNEIENAIN